MQRRPQKKSRRHRHGKASRARGGLLIICALLRVVDAFFLLSMPDGPTRVAVVTIVLIGMWTTALLTAVWLRQGWARIILIAIFILCAVAAMIMIPSSTQSTSLLTAYFVIGVVALGSSAWLIYSRDVRRLISRERE